METIRFAHSVVLLLTIPFVILAIIYRIKWYKPVIYKYPLTHFLMSKQQAIASRQRLFFVLRLAALFLLALLVGKPQLVDTTSRIQDQGIDIMLVLDISGSMQCFDDQYDRRLRIDIAKDEAIHFVQKRESDAIGLVLFAKQAVSRLPLTLDKTMLKETISAVQLGDIDPEGTMLSKALLVACARLKNSVAKSKVIILLTDGEPSPDDSSPEVPLEIAKKLGIKIYTIGIGDDQTGGLQEHPFFGVIPVGARLNKQLLQAIASSTGGKFFEAKKPHELRLIYDQIDALEKTDYETNVFSNYYDWFIPFVWLVIGLVAAELVLSSLLWLVI